MNGGTEPCGTPERLKCDAAAFIGEVTDFVEDHGEHESARAKIAAASVPPEA